MKVLPPQIMREWEQGLIRAGLCSEEGLMRQAVEGMMTVLRPQLSAVNRVVVLAGPGNNGLDALWLGWECLRAGANVTVSYSHPQRSLPDFGPFPALRQHASFRHLQLPASRPAEIRESVLVIDGLLGVAARYPLQAPFSDMIQTVRSWKLPHDFYVAVDVPTGLDVAHGQGADQAFPADLTLALGAVKSGCVKDCARPAVGQIRLVPLGLPESLLDRSTAHPLWVDGQEILPWLPSAPADVHKHQQGRVAIWAGSKEMPGAGILAVRAAVRAGAGLVYAAVPESAMRALMSQCPETIWVSWDEGDALPEEFLRCHACVVGPGLGTKPKAVRRLRELLSTLKCPVVVDADGLNILPLALPTLGHECAPMILTPHGGELARLLSVSRVDERLEGARTVLAHYKAAVVVAKGPNTVVVGPAVDEVSYNSTGNPGMAKGGMGDVLSGILGALLASGLEPSPAARLAVWWHGDAADRAAERRGYRCVTASDVIESLADSCSHWPFSCL